MTEHLINLNPKSGDDLKSTKGEDSKIVEIVVRYAVAINPG